MRLDNRKVLRAPLVPRTKNFGRFFGRLINNQISIDNFFCRHQKIFFIKKTFKEA